MISKESTTYEGSIVSVDLLTSFYLEKFRVEPSTGEISSRSGATRLEPRAMELLVYLASREGQVVSMETLKLDVWGGPYVVDAAVKRCISQVRKAFGDDPAHPRIIQTVPKRGYRLIAAVCQQSKRRRRNKVALQFAAAIAALSLGGSWANVQSAKTGSNPTAAIDLHEVARTLYHRYDEVGTRNAIDIYESLLQDNPQDPVALAGLADTLMQRYLRESQDEQLARRAHDAALTSIRLDDTKPDAFKALGAYYHFQGQHDRAITFYRQAVRRDHRYWTALNNGGEVLRDRGQLREARSWFRCALAATPRKADVLIRLAGTEKLSGNLSAAEDYLRIATILEPSNKDAKVALSELRHNGTEGDAMRGGVTSGTRQFHAESGSTCDQLST